MVGFRFLQIKPPLFLFHTRGSNYYTVCLICITLNTKRYYNILNLSSCQNTLHVETKISKNELTKSVLGTKFPMYTKKLNRISIPMH